MYRERLQSLGALQLINSPVLRPNKSTDTSLVYLDSARHDPRSALAAVIDALAKFYLQRPMRTPAKRACTRSPPISDPV